jgi:hypothetical protein
VPRPTSYLCQVCSCNCWGKLRLVGILDISSADAFVVHRRRRLVHALNLVFTPDLLVLLKFHADRAHSFQIAGPYYLSGPISEAVNTPATRRRGRGRRRGGEDAKQHGGEGAPIVSLPCGSQTP